MPQPQQFGHASSHFLREIRGLIRSFFREANETGFLGYSEQNTIGLN